MKQAMHEFFEYQAEEKQEIEWPNPVNWKRHKDFDEALAEFNGEAMFITRRKAGFSVRGVQERLSHYGRLAGVKVSPHQLHHTFGRRWPKQRCRY